MQYTYMKIIRIEEDAQKMNNCHFLGNKPTRLYSNTNLIKDKKIQCEISVTVVASEYKYKKIKKN